jgi:glyoxylase-like metal-dependent hydrolase (beta-lactamase superfamily II)
MLINTVVLGDFQTNCYCVRPDEKTRKCLVIDPGLDPAALLQYLQTERLEPAVIALTHGHVDHIAGVEAMREHWPKAKTAIHKEDADMLGDPVKNLSMMAGCMVMARPAEILWDREQDLTLAGMPFSLLHTPGHTPGGICMYSAAEGLAFVGDTLFAGGIGRTDFARSDYAQLIESIQNKLLTLPENTKIYPGHGPATTIRSEKRFNPFIIGGGSF